MSQKTKEDPVRGVDDDEDDPIVEAAAKEERIARHNFRKTRFETMTSKMVGEDAKKDSSEEKGSNWDELLAQTGYTLHVQRSGTAQWKGHQLPRRVARVKSPVTLEDLEYEIQEGHGGGSYAISIQDDNYRMRGRFNMFIEGDPKLPSDDDDDDAALAFETERSPHLVELERQIEEARLQKELARIKGEDNGKSDEKWMTVIKEMMDQNNKRFDELTHQQQLQNLQNEIAQLRSGPQQSSEELRYLKRDLESRTADLNEMKAERDRLRDKVSSLESELQCMRDEAREARSQAELEKRFAEMGGSKVDPAIEMMKILNSKSSSEEDRMYRIFELIAAQKGATVSPTQQMKDLAETMIAVQQSLGIGGGDSDSLPKEIIGAVKDIVGEFRDARAAGRPVDKQQVDEQLDLIRNEYRSQMAQQQPIAQQSVSAGNIEPSHAPMAGAERMASPSVGQAPAPAAPAAQDQRKIRVDGVLDMIISEIDLMPNAPQWPQLAWSYLPQDILQKIVYAQKDEEVFGAIRQDASQEKLLALFGKVKSDDAKRKWIRQGVNLIKQSAEEVRKQQASQQQATSPQPAADSGDGSSVQDGAVVDDI